MLYWETAEEVGEPDDAELEWIALWNPLPKVVFSTTLSEVRGRARLASGSVAEEIERLRAESGEGDIAVGGAMLAAEAAAADLIDEYRMVVHPVLVGGHRVKRWRATAAAWPGTPTGVRPRRASFAPVSSWRGPRHG